MTIENVTMFRAICNRCGKSAQDESDYYASLQEDIALETATDADWFAYENLHVCFDCLNVRLVSIFGRAA